MSDRPEIPAGEFSAWLDATLPALASGGASDVPCGECNACCRSAMFVHIGPGETSTLAQVPHDLRFPAPGLPDGHVLLGHDEQGRCPMLAGDECSIYAHRPRTCRAFDCRVYAAAGVVPEQPAIAERVARWVFHYATPSARERHEAVLAAARLLRERAANATGEAGRMAPTEIALRALQLHPELLPGGEGEARTPSLSPAEAIEAALRARREREREQVRVR